MKIVAIIRNAKHLPEGIPATLRIGDPTVEGGPVVSKILYCRKGYSGGVKGEYPAYVVKYAGIPEINQIPETEVVDVAIDPEDKPTNTTDADVQLPD